MKIAIYDFNNVLSDVEKELSKRHTMVTDWRKADRIVIWSEISAPWIKKAQEKGKKVILMQHGRRGTSRIYPPFNEVPISDIICAWGENDKKRLMECGVAEERIKVTGTTVLKHLRPRKDHEGLNVVFSPEHWDTEVIENDIVKGQLEKMKGVKIISKLLVGEHDSRRYPHPISSDRHSENHLEICADVLATADVVVGISESTFELMAEALDIPVVIADIWIPKPCNGDDRYMIYRREYSDACTRVQDPFRLNDTIWYQLTHPYHLQTKRAEVAIADGGVNLDPLKEICNVIEHG